MLPSLGRENERQRHDVAAAGDDGIKFILRIVIREKYITVGFLFDIDIQRQTAAGE